MDVYRLVLFIHVAAIVGLGATLAIEWVSVRFLRRATSYEQAREWTRLWPFLVSLGAPSILLAVASGIYLATLLGVWRAGWVAVAIPTMLFIAVVGGTTAPARKRVETAIGQHIGRLPPTVEHQLRHSRWLAASLRIRTALLLGLLFEMTVKPETGGLLMVAVGLAGVGWGTFNRS
jgi:hypothetical protein